MYDIDDWLRADFARRLQKHGIERSDQLNRAQRMTYASTVEDVLKITHDIRMPILLPLDFAIYANDLVNKALVSAGLPETRVLDPVVGGVELFRDSKNANDREGLFMWTIGSHLMWQQLDRRIDE